MQRILIADDHDFTRIGLAAVLGAAPGCMVVGEVRDGIAAVAAVERLRPDVLILDNHMPGLDGIEAARQVAGLKSACRIIMLTMSGHEACVRAAFRAGIRAYVLKGNAQAEIFAALDALASGEAYLSPSLGDIDAVTRWLQNSAAEQPREDPLASLTTRERMVFFAALRGLTSKQIAAALSISSRTVETHRENMLAKLGVAKIDKLLPRAIAWGLVELDSEGRIVGEAFDPVQLA